jgi:RNA polymerase sigma-70 factor (ECF subfamily)
MFPSTSSGTRIYIAPFNPCSPFSLFSPSALSLNFIITLSHFYIFICYRDVHNRTYALAKANGKLEAIQEAERLQLTNNQYYFTLLGELYRDVDNSKSIDCFKKALALARTQADKNAISKRLIRLGV